MNRKQAKAIGAALAQLRPRDTTTTDYALWRMMVSAVRDTAIMVRWHDAFNAYVPDVP